MLRSISRFFGFGAITLGVFHPARLSMGFAYFRSTMAPQHLGLARPKKGRYMRLPILATLAALLGGCTMVYVEKAGRDVAVENRTATVGNDGTAANSDRRDPTINAAIPWWTP